MLLSASNHLTCVRQCTLVLIPAHFSSQHEALRQDALSFWYNFCVSFERHSKEVGLRLVNQFWALVAINSANFTPIDLKFCTLIDTVRISIFIIFRNRQFSRFFQTSYRYSIYLPSVAWLACTASTTLMLRTESEILNAKSTKNTKWILTLEAAQKLNILLCIALRWSISCEAYTYNILV